MKFSYNVKISLIALLLVLCTLFGACNNSLPVETTAGETTPIVTTPAETTPTDTTPEETVPAQIAIEEQEETGEDKQIIADSNILL